MTDIITGAILIGISLFIQLTIRNYPSRTVMEGLGPGFLPNLLSLLLFVLSSVLIIVGIVKLRNHVKLQADSKKERISLKGPASIAAAVFVYLILFRYLGFLILSPLLIFTVMRIMDDGYKRAIIMAVVLAATVYYIFRIFLGVPLPHGSLL